MMIIPCPSCKEQVFVFNSIVKGPSDHGNEAWVCMKCDTIVCVDCYHTHISEQHPSLIKKLKKV